jgi:hypothetical protein
MRTGGERTERCAPARLLRAGRTRARGVPGCASVRAMWHARCVALHPQRMQRRARGGDGLPCRMAED